MAVGNEWPFAYGVESTAQSCKRNAFCREGVEELHDGEGKEEGFILMGRG